MKYLYLSIILFAGLALNGQLANLAFETDSDPSKLNVVLKLSFDNPGGLGSSNIRFNFDDLVLANPVLLEHYIQSNGESYLSVNMTTTNIGGQQFVSFDPTFFGGTAFAVPAGVGNEVPIALIQFDIIDAGANVTDLTWRDIDNANNPPGATIVRDNFAQLDAGTLQNANAASLPVELTYFQANRYNDNSATLEWEAATELDFSHYEIERSMDGREWSQLAKVQGQALNTTGAEYSYLDSNISLPRNTKSTVYYRLKMVDNNGQFEYSDVRTVGFDVQAVEVSVFPNPTANTITIESEFPVSHVSIFDIDGKLVIDQDYLDAEINLSNITSGMYRVVISTEAGEYVKSIVKIE